jgi:hypothetical protein
MITTVALSSLTFGHPSPERQVSTTSRMHDGGCDLRMRIQGHDLQLPYNTNVVQSRVHCYRRSIRGLDRT